jgi:hypothetical protein
LRQAIASKLLADFSEEIGELAVKRVAKVKEFVTHHPQYRQLLKYRAEEIKRVPSTLSDEKMELELFKIQQTLDLEVKKEAGKYCGSYPRPTIRKPLNSNTWSCSIRL